MSENTSRIRLCYVVDSRYAGGAERYISHLVLGLDRAVFDPVVLAKDSSGLDGWCRSLETEGIGVFRTRMNLPFAPFDAIPVMRAFSNIEPRIVHVNVPGPYDGQMGLAAPLGRLAGCRAVVTTEHLPRVERLWKRAAVKNVAYQWVDRVLTICESNVRYLIERQNVSPEKIEVVHNGVPARLGKNCAALRSIERRKLGLHGGTVGMVYVGSLIERKGLGTLMEALGNLGHEDWRLFVVGEGEHESVFKKTASEKGLGERVRFLGSLAERTVEGVLCAMDIMVLPSFMEGMPYVILEAMACSLPVISTSIDGIPEAVSDGETGFLVRPGDAPALRAVVERLAGDVGLRRKFGVHARKRFDEMFTLERHIAKMEAFYVKLLDG